MKYLGTEYQSDKFILTGICSGAKIAYEAQCNDAKVVGAASINIYRLLDTTDDRLASAVKKSIRSEDLLQFSLPSSQRELIRLIVNWLNSAFKKTSGQSQMIKRSKYC